MTRSDPFHEGERRVQERAGETAMAVRTGAILGHAIPPSAMPFLAQQRLVAVGTIDESGAVWASLLFGTPGMLTASADGTGVTLDRTRIVSRPDELPWPHLAVGAQAGLLAIELPTRRRLRVNGAVSAVGGGAIGLQVHEAYPNCPKYIQRRHLDVRPNARLADPGPRSSGASLDQPRRSLIERADTFFVASRHPTRGVDVSHRGGSKGFVRVLDAARLRVPDYAGNSMFNTLGNLDVDDRAGLVFADFDGGTLLQMIGTATLRFDLPDDPRQPTGGSGRYWDFQIAGWRELGMPQGPRWALLDFSPHNPLPRSD